MSLINRISAKELNMMTLWIDSYATSQRGVTIEHLLREWDEKKTSLGKLFGDRLILSKSIKIRRDINQLVEDMSVMLSFTPAGVHFDNEFYKKVIQPTRHYYSVKGQTSHIEADWDKMREADRLQDMMTPQSLARNVYEGETFSVCEPDWEKPFKINTGAKISRILGKLAALYGIDGFESFRVEHAKVLNQKEYHGTLCLSIHPFDYMTMSDNNSDWQSCMNWRNEGCYRQGTVEMMNSDKVIVAYLKADEDMEVPGGTWNNKKWRELFIVDDRFMTNIKGYPYCSDELSKAVLEWLLELTAATNYAAYNKEIVPYTPWKRTPIESLGIKVDIDPNTGYMYNDFSSGREQWGCFDPNFDWARAYSFSYSGASECMACGELDVSVESEGSLMGECCDEYYECEECGDHYYNEDELTEIDGVRLCSYCVENRCTCDSLHDELHLEHNLVTVHLALGDEVMRYQNISIYNEDMENIRLLKKYFTRISRVGGLFWSSSTYFVRVTECTTEGLKLFGYDSMEDLLNDEYHLTERNESLPAKYQNQRVTDGYDLLYRWDHWNDNSFILYLDIAADN